MKKTKNPLKGLTAVSIKNGGRMPTGTVFRAGSSITKRVKTCLCKGTRPEWNYHTKTSCGNFMGLERTKKEWRGSISMGDGYTAIQRNKKEEYVITQEQINLTSIMGT